MISLLAFSGGWKAASDHYAAQAVKQIERVVIKERVVTKVVTQAASEAQAAHDRIVYRTQKVIHEVPVLLGADADLRLPNGWVCGYNASLGLPDNAATSGSACVASGSIRADEALSVTIGNNGLCVAQADQLNRLLDLYAAVKAQVNARP